MGVLSHDLRYVGGLAASGRTSSGEGSVFSHRVIGTEIPAPCYCTELRVKVEIERLDSIRRSQLVQPPSKVSICLDRKSGFPLTQVDGPLEVIACKSRLKTDSCKTSRLPWEVWHT